ncbi:MAG: hypothetical protein IPL61_14080 [Myxococcales bacterium]|nr:hypothetical protein [Myxococcales bacterium]
MKLVSWMAVGAFVVGAIGCGRTSTSGPTTAAAGEERGACRADRTCAEGLMCLSDLCVRPPGADCQVVGAHAASIELGNYAAVEARAPTIAKFVALCEQVHVTKDEGACLVETRDQWSAAQCAPKLYPHVKTSGGDCKAIAGKVRSAIASSMGAPDPQIQQMLDKVAGVIEPSCEQDGWPDALKACLRASAGTMDGFNACEQLTPPALKQKMSERMQQAMR